MTALDVHAHGILPGSTPSPPPLHSAPTPTCLLQALFVVLLLPITTTLARISLDQLPDYLLRGSQCLRGLTPACGTDCSHCPWLPLAYIATNLMFNISMLLLLRCGCCMMLSACLGGADAGQGLLGTMDSALGCAARTCANGLMCAIKALHCANVWT